MNRQFADDLGTDLARGHVLEWAELYALDAISTDERRGIDVFLADADPAVGATFTERVRACHETMAIAYAGGQEEPPADLFERIVSQLPGSTGTAAPTQTDPAAATAASGAPAGHDGDELARRRTAKASMSSRAARWVVAASAAAVLAVGGVTIAQNLQQSTLQEQVLQASDVRTAQLTLAAGGTADLAVSGEEDAAVVTLSGVPAPAPGYVYQMWRIPADGTDPESVGTNVGDDVAGTKVTELEDIGGFSAIAITVEPDGGSATPTLPIVAQIPLGA